MTIAFQCPKCKGLCAFAGRHAGKSARCTNCQQRFIIPSESGRKAKKLEIKEKPDGAISGFYRAVFVNSWKAFGGKAGAMGLLFVAIVACLKFFVSHMNYELSVYSRFAEQWIDIPLPFGHVMALACWGCLLWYYSEIMYWTAFDRDELPEVYLGGAIDVWASQLMCNIMKSLYTFSIALAVVELPFVIIIAILMKIGVEWSWPLRMLVVAGLFTFPMAVLTVSVGRDLVMVLRPDYLIMPVIRAFRPYLVTAGLVILATVLLFKSVAYSPGMSAKGVVIVGLYLAANIAVQVVAIVAVRSVGLFCRHYGCYLEW
ncbi:MAG: hypothetical protein ACYTFK_08295 [Planctomycetota bacterium]|jgi:hypothetical protein